MQRRGLAATRGLVPLAAALLGALVTFVVVSATGADRRAEALRGPFGPEGPRMREQLWLMPSGNHTTSLRATVFRPDESVSVPGDRGMIRVGGPVRRPMVVINHGTSEATRHSVSMPVYYWLSRWFVERGYVVVLPQRRGHGATGGDLIESRGNCSDPHHMESGLVASDDIAAAIAFMAKQDFVKPAGAIVVGISTGGWAALATASRNVPGVAGVVNIAGGRGGYAYGAAGAVCQKAELIAAAGKFGQTTRIPALWLYAENDSYFGPKLAASMFEAWSLAGAPGSLHVYPPYGMEGHNIADDLAGWQLWGAAMSGFLKQIEHREDAPPLGQRAEPRGIGGLARAAFSWLGGNRAASKIAGTSH